MIKYFVYSYLFFSITTITFYAKVIGVTDGDSITVLTDENQQIKIRLEGIDCPEPKQDFGQKAKQETVNLCFGKQVKIVKSGEDMYGRSLAFVFVGDTCVNRRLIELGMAWHYKKYNSDSTLAQLEIDAREKKIGIWSNPASIAPWEFRKMQRTN